MNLAFRCGKCINALSGHREDTQEIELPKELWKIIMKNLSDWERYFVMPYVNRTCAQITKASQLERNAYIRNLADKFLWRDVPLSELLQQACTVFSYDNQRPSSKDVINYIQRHGFSLLEQICASLYKYDFTLASIPFDRHTGRSFYVSWTPKVSTTFTLNAGKWKDLRTLFNMQVCKNTFYKEGICISREISLYSELAKKIEIGRLSSWEEVEFNQFSDATRLSFLAKEVIDVSIKISVALAAESNIVFLKAINFEAGDFFNKALTLKFSCDAKGIIIDADSKNKFHLLCLTINGLRNFVWDADDLHDKSSFRRPHYAQILRWQVYGATTEALNRLYKYDNLHLQTL